MNKKSYTYAVTKQGSRQQYKIQSTIPPMKVLFACVSFMRQWYGKPFRNKLEKADKHYSLLNPKQHNFSLFGYNVDAVEFPNGLIFAIDAIKHQHSPYIYSQSPTELRRLLREVLGRED